MSFSGDRELINNPGDECDMTIIERDGAIALYLLICYLWLAAITSADKNSSSNDE